MIDYFDFLKLYPGVINLNGFDYMDINIINHVQHMNKEASRDKPILGIDFTQLSDIIFDDKINNRDTILTKNIAVGLMGNIFFWIKQTDGLIICEKNNTNEKKGNFHIKICDYKGFRELKEIEIDCIKRTVLIDKILENGKDD